MAVIRERPMKAFRVLKPHGCYAKGAVIQPTGMYRDILLRKGVIEEVRDVTSFDVPEELDNRAILPRGELMRRGPGRPRTVR